MWCAASPLVVVAAVVCVCVCVCVCVRVFVARGEGVGVFCACACACMCACVCVCEFPQDLVSSLFRSILPRVSVTAQLLKEKEAETTSRRRASVVCILGRVATAAAVAAGTRSA